MLLLRSLFFTFLLPGTVTVLIPYWLSYIVPVRYFHWFQYLGLPLILIGAAGLLGCIWQFFSEGHGTLAPIDAPKELVVRGLYKYVRNPMYVSVVTILIGEAVVFDSTVIIIEAVIFIVLAYCSLCFTRSLRFDDSLASRMKNTLTELADGFHDRGRVE